jgi:hypothetical protein
MLHWQAAEPSPSQLAIGLTVAPAARRADSESAFPSVQAAQQPSPRGTLLSTGGSAGLRAAWPGPRAQRLSTVTTRHPPASPEVTVTQ